MLSFVLSSMGIISPVVLLINCLCLGCCFVFRRYLSLLEDFEQLKTRYFDFHCGCGGLFIVVGFMLMSVVVVDV